MLVLFATREGQTRRIAEHVAAALRAQGYLAEVCDARTDAPDTLEPYGAAIVAGSVHVQRHEPELVAFVRKHRHALEEMPTAFLSVSLAEAGAEDAAAAPGDREVARAATEGLVRDFFEQTGWRADRAMPWRRVPRLLAIRGAEEARDVVDREGQPRVDRHVEGPRIHRLGRPRPVRRRVRFGLRLTRAVDDFDPQGPRGGFPA